MTYTKIVISGGGINGIAIVGAISEFSKFYDINEIKEIICVSVGSIIGLLIAIGYDMKDIENIFKEIKMEEFTEYDIMNIFEKFGMDDGEKGKKLIHAILINKGLDKDLTFEELFKLMGKKIIIVGSDVTYGCDIYFSKDNYPTMKIADAIRISTSFPAMYSPVLFENRKFVDGGLLAPYPIDYFCGAEDVIGFLINRDKPDPNDKGTHYETDTIDKYFYSLLYILLNKYQDKCYLGYEKNTVFMRRSELVSPMDYNITKEKKQMLLDKGKECFLRFYVNKDKDD